MKKSLLVVLFSLLSFLSKAQVPVNATQITLPGPVTINRWSTDTTLSNNLDTRVPTEKAVKTYVDNKFATIDSAFIVSLLGFSPFNPSGTSSQYIKGDGTYATYVAPVNPDWSASSGLAQILNKPTIPTNTNQLINGSGFISGISGSDVTTALGYTPYNSSNPNNYINSVTGTMVNTALGYVPYDGGTNPNGYLSTINSSMIAAALGYTPYSSSNPNNYISNINSSMVTTALGFTPMNPNGTTAQYFRGDGSLSTFPTNLSSFTNGPGYIDASALTPYLPITTAASTYFPIPTGTTLQYIRGNGTLATFPTNVSTFTNDAGYLTAITSLMITTALGYTPYNGATNPNSYITTAGARTAISVTNTGTSGPATYNNTTGVFNIPDYTPSVTFNSSPGRSLSTTGSNNTFTISATKNARVNYTINFAVALALVTSNGVVSLDYSTNGGSSWTSVSSVSNAYTVALTLTGNWDNNLSGEIPAGALVRIYRSSASNVTITLTKQQEVTY